MPEASNGHVTLTIRLKSSDKAQLVTMAEGYGMTMTEYITMLVERDASGT